VERRSIRDQQDPVKRPENDSRGLWQQLSSQPLAVRLSFFTTRPFDPKCDEPAGLFRLNAGGAIIRAQLFMELCLVWALHLEILALLTNWG
jgi:hypothetical protein